MFSSVLRRWMQLFLPALAVQALVLLATLLGLYNRRVELHDNWPFVGTNERQQKIKATASEQVADWAHGMWVLVNPFSVSQVPAYDIHLWTLRVEFRFSIILFAVQVGVSMMKVGARLGSVLVLCVYCVAIDKTALGLFIAGIGLAEFLLIREEGAKLLPSIPADAQPKKQSKRMKVVWMVVFGIGLWLLSTPAKRWEHTPGYRTLVRLLKPKHGILLDVGASIVMLSICGCPPLQKPFSTPFALYLGKISFPLYIVHGPVYDIIGIRLVPFFWGILGNKTLWQYELGWLLSLAIVTPIVVWVADLVMRGVDGPSVRFSRKVAGWVSI